MLDQYVKAFGERGKCYRFRNHDLIKNMKAGHLLSAIAWGGGAFAMQALNILKTNAGDEVEPAPVEEAPELGGRKASLPQGEAAPCLPTRRLPEAPRMH